MYGINGINRGIALPGTCPRADFLITGDKDYHAGRYGYATIRDAELLERQIRKEALAVSSQQPLRYGSTYNAYPKPKAPSRRHLSEMAAPKRQNRAWSPDRSPACFPNSMTPDFVGPLGLAPMSRCRSAPVTLEAAWTAADQGVKLPGHPGKPRPPGWTHSGFGFHPWFHETSEGLTVRATERGVGQVAGLGNAVRLPASVKTAAQAQKRRAAAARLASAGLHG